MQPFDKQPITATVQKVFNETKFIDLHTHLFDPALGEDLFWWGIDHLLTYHYLVSELFRARPDLEYKVFWNLSKAGQADLVWDELFVKRSPVSEACRGVCTVLHKLGLDPKVKKLDGIRDFYRQQKLGDHITRVLDLAGLKSVYMTNDPLDAQEAQIWKKGFDRDPRFIGVTRLDSAIVNWPAGVKGLKALGYKVTALLNAKTISEVKRYLHDWSEVYDARYLGISLPPYFTYPDKKSPLTTLLTKAAFSVATERKIPVAMMIGVRRGVNPNLGQAADAGSIAPTINLERMAADFPQVKMLATYITRENQHETCIVARKFKNIVPIGCWWFCNTPQMIKDINTMRMELLGLSYVPQYSDSRIFDQLIYKWIHSREVICSVFVEKYYDLARSGWAATEAEIKRDVEMVMGGALIQ